MRPEASDVVLDMLAEAPQLAQAAQVRQPGTPRRIGAGRTVDATGSPQRLQARLRWQPTVAGGLAAAVRFRSPPARALRLGVLVQQLPAGAVVRVYAPQDTNAFEIGGAEILAVIDRNLAAGDPAATARIWWSPPTVGDEVTLEVELPPGTPADTVQMAVPALSHIFVLPEEADADEGSGIAKIGESASCNVDVGCNAAYSQDSNSVARMTFTSGGSTYLCTGTLLNDRAGSGTPYFVSANHCVSSQSAASTLTTDWFYKAASCGSKTLGAAVRTLKAGATLLYANTDADTSFMRLNETPPAGAVCAGWDPSAQASGLAVAGLHHPSGDVQKLSLGQVASFNNCSPLTATSETFSCSAGTADTARYLGVQWSSGVTEAGSSGSGIFSSSADGSRHYLVGTLYGGTASCAKPQGSDYYGRFDVAYRAALYQWLEAAPK